MNLKKWILVIDILYQILFTLLTLIAFQILQEGPYQFAVHGFSSVCPITFNSHLEQWSMDSNMVGKIWAGMSPNSIHLLQFKIQGHFQKRGLWMPVFQNSFRGKKSKICSITFTISSLNFTNLPSWVFYLFLCLFVFIQKPSKPFQNGSF